MSHALRRRRYFSALAVVSILAAGLGVWLFLSAQTSSSEPLSPPESVSPTATVVSGVQLDGIASEELGLKLSPPGVGVQPQISREQAGQVALARTPSAFGNGIRDGVFARVESGFTDCRSCLAWVFSMDVSAWPNLKHYLFIVDANSGQPIGGLGTCHKTANDCP